jgi:uncharacterized protein
MMPEGPYSAEYADLLGYLSGCGRAVLAFSGGTDSSFLLHACREAGADVVPALARGPFQTEDEAARAGEISSTEGFDLRVLDVDILSVEGMASNPPDRCYRCKTAVFSLIRDCASTLGIGMVMDATNASDDPSERPGMRALEELGVVSPLRICGITKPMVRELSRRAGLRMWDHPSDSCLATRIPCGMPITMEDLRRIEACESEIRKLGVRDFRVRSMGNEARFDSPDPGALGPVRKGIEGVLMKYYDTVSFGVRKPGL